MFSPSTLVSLPYDPSTTLLEAMTGGSPTRWRAGVPTSLNSLTLDPDIATIPRPHSSSHRNTDIAAHQVGASTAGGSGDHPSGISTVPQFSTSATSHQRTIPDHVLDNPENFDDSPYVPPRVTQAELESYPALHPRVCNVYDPPNLDLQHQYSYEGGTSPAESHHSAESNWSTSSSSSTSSQQVTHNFLVDPTAQYPQNPLPTPHAYPQQHYPAYHGQHRHGLEHVRYGEQPSNTGGSYYRTSPQGFSIDSILSPEIFDDTGTRVNMLSQMNYPVTSSQGSSSSSAIPVMSSTTPVDSTRSLFPDAGPYLRQQLGLSAHQPISLQSLPDPPLGEKPSTPLPMLIKLAIYGSPGKQLTLQEIYAELENRFQWFRDHKHERAWKNSIRHNLSLNKVFRHVPRPITEPGKGSYWQLDVSGGEGYKRPRKRRPKNKTIASEEEDEEASEIDEDRPSPSDPAGLNRSSVTPVEDANIDPGLRSEGHVVGEGRARPTTRRAGGSPYPSQSPRYQQGPLPVVTGQDASALGQHSIRFGQPSFGQTSFPTYTQVRPMPVATSSASFAALSSSSMAMATTTQTTACPQTQHVTPYNRTAHIPNPQPPPRAGIEYITDPGGLPAARRIKPSQEPQAHTEEDAARSSPESSSGSSRTWNDGRSRTGTQDS